MAIVTTATKKPRKISQVPGATNPFVSMGVPKALSTAAKKPRTTSAPGAAPAPPASTPVQETVPTITPARVVLPGSTADRATGASQFGGTLATGNRNLTTLARNLGGISSVNQYGYAPAVDDPNTPGINEAELSPGSITTSQLNIDPNDPNSALAVIGRNESRGIRSVGLNNLSRNTFGGGIRLTEEDQVRTDANNQRAKATQDYTDAVNDLVDQLTGEGGAYGTLKSIFRTAGAADDSATADAINKAAPQAPPPAAAAPAAAPNPYLEVWQKGTWQGQPAKYTNNKWWYKRADGKWIAIPGQI